MQEVEKAIEQEAIDVALQNEGNTLRMHRIKNIEGALKRVATLAKAERDGQLDEIRKAFEDYVGSEGCECCEAYEHDDQGKALGALLSK